MLEAIFVKFPRSCGHMLVIDQDELGAIFQKGKTHRSKAKRSFRINKSVSKRAKCKPKQTELHLVLINN